MDSVMTPDRASFVPVITVGYKNGVFYVLESTMPGLNVEAERYDEFVAITEDLAPGLLGLTEPPNIMFRKADQTMI